MKIATDTQHEYRTSGSGNTVAYEQANDRAHSLQRPTTQEELLADEVHVWRAPLDATAPHIERLRRTLSSDERQRADRFRSEPDRRKFIIGRGQLRIILGGYLHKRPEQLRFAYSALGKPFMEAGVDQRFCFNVSHSHERVLYAIAWRRRIGIDIEHLRPVVDAEALARRFFTTREYTQLRSIPCEQKQDAFLACWTRKESFIKATGEGLTSGLGSFDVSVAPDQPAELHRIPDSAGETAEWTFENLDAGSGYIGTVAVEGHDLRLVYREFPDDFQGGNK